MLKPFKRNVHCPTCDSAYIGDIMAQILRNEWQINMVGTIQLNRCGADAGSTCKEMTLHTYESAVWQHNTIPLCMAAWADNAVVKTLSNFHTPVVIEEGLLRRGIDEDGNRERDQSYVDAPEQMVDYCNTFHLIDKGNGIESRYVMGRVAVRNMGGR